MRRYKARRQLILSAALGIILTSCANKPPARDNPAPKRPDPTICAPLEDAPPLEGGIVQPTTDAGREATRLLLGSTGELFSWGGRGWARAGRAKDEFCN